MIKPLKNMLADLPDAAWIIMSIGVLILLTALGLKILISDNIVVGSTGMTLEDLATADDATLMRPDVSKGIEEALTNKPDPETEAKLKGLQIRQTHIRMRKDAVPDK
jgi:hypothetical protein